MLTEDQLHRYARHIVLPEVGGVGQEKLLQSRVLVVGAGGLGAPLLLYLAAAGVGTIGVVDDDAVDLSNLQRQVIHATDRIGMPKVDSAAEAVAAVNPGVRLVTHPTRLDAGNARRADRRLRRGRRRQRQFRDPLHAQRRLSRGRQDPRRRRPAALRRAARHLQVGLDPALPCYRCLYPSPPPPGIVPSCAEGGVLGALAGTMGSLQATEILKEAMGIGESLAGHLLIYDALTTTVRKMALKRNPRCATCGDG